MERKDYVFTKKCDFTQNTFWTIVIFKVGGGAFQTLHPLSLIILQDVMDLLAPHGLNAFHFHSFTLNESI